MIGKKGTNEKTMHRYSHVPVENMRLILERAYFSEHEADDW